MLLVCLLLVFDARCMLQHYVTQAIAMSLALLQISLVMMWTQRPAHHVAGIHIVILTTCMQHNTLVLFVWSCMHCHPDEWWHQYVSHVMIMASMPAKTLSATLLNTWLLLERQHQWNGKNAQQVIYTSCWKSIHLWPAKIVLQELSTSNRATSKDTSSPVNKTV